MDYYKILELKRDCTDADIKKAYRRLAVQWHPERNESTNKDIVAQKFGDLSEAYTVLADPKLRAVFDQCGEKGLKMGLPNGKGGFVGAWSYNLNPEQQFAEFFGSFSPFADFFNGDTGSANLFNKNGDKGGAKMEAQVLNLYCSLEELYQGCTKKTKVVRQKLNADGKSSSPEERIMTVDVKAGWREGTKITFTCEGDEAPDCVTGDIIFVLREKPHPRFTRNKNDLHFTANITLLEALTGVTVEIETLNGRKVPIAVNEIVREGYQRKVPDEGMPLASNPAKKGSLVISFKTAFPEMLTEAQKTQLKEAL